jgi:hypothetical protein
MLFSHMVSYSHAGRRLAGSSSRHRHLDQPTVCIPKHIHDCHRTESESDMIERHVNIAPTCVETELLRARYDICYDRRYQLDLVSGIEVNKSLLPP